MTRPTSAKSATDRDTEPCSVRPTGADTRKRPPDEQEGVAEWVRRSTAAQGLPEFVDDPVIGDTIARILLDD